MIRATGGARVPHFQAMTGLVLTSSGDYPAAYGKCSKPPMGWDAFPDGSRIHNHPMGIQTVSEHLGFTK